MATRYVSTNQWFLIKFPLDTFCHWSSPSLPSSSLIRESLSAVDRFSYVFCCWGHSDWGPSHSDLSPHVQLYALLQIPTHQALLSLYHPNARLSSQYFSLLLSPRTDSSSSFRTQNRYNFFQEAIITFPPFFSHVIFPLSVTYVHLHHSPYTQMDSSSVCMPIIF